ncbi:PAS domain S-box protein [Leptolyngbya sp. FACHB-8]|uniref:PAS domain S-box protein n=1 Tax=unclassified Leptolyngbya TaxID=2650499 RepID=UPI0016846EFE|nr:PAS domain S-box protein [Leptolyngbya sp. FACHB-8]MBD1909198.1 PAS domain S-box protein [Leptolyngbya sp. FACHB-8]
MNDSSAPVNWSIEEVNTLRQRLLELEASHCQCQQQIEQLTQQLSQERIARQQAEERLQLILTSAQVVAWDMDLMASRVVCSANALEVWGIQEGTVEDFIAVIHPDDRQQVIQAAERAIAGETTYSEEYRITGPDGMIHWLNSQGRVFLNETGRGVRMLGLSVDVSDRKRAEAELRQREQEFRTLVESTPDIVARYDRDLRHLYINPSIERALGVPPEYFIGKTGIELGFTDARSQSWYATLQQVFETGQSYLLEYEFPNPDGELRFYQSRFTPELMEGGQVKTVIGVSRDVTEYKRVEISLRQSEERLRLATEGAQMGTWDVDLKTGKAIWSEQHFTMMGYEPVATGEASEQMWVSRLHPDDLERVIHTWEQARQDHTLYESEYRVIRANDGQIAWFMGLGNFTYDQTGQAIRSIGVLFDITARKQAEAALAKSNQTLQAVIQACPLAIMGLRADGTVRIWNPAAERIFGWSQQEVLGQFLPAIPIDKRDEFLNNLSITLQGQGLARVELQRQKKDNTRFDVELWTAPVDEAQAGISCVSVVSDITARKRTEAALRLSEERLRSFVTANVIGILFGDLEGGIQEANDEFLRIVGYSREDLRSGTLRWIDITPPEYLSLDEAAIVEARQRGACTPYEKEYIRKDGSRVPVFVGFGLTLTEREEAVAFILDLSDRKQAEAEREQLLQREQAAREQAEAANRVKDEFLAVLSHELRTPLNPILGWTKLLRTRQFDAAATDRALDIIERNTKLQVQLIEDLLDVSRILQGKLSLNVSSVDVTKTVEAALETVRLSAETKGIQIETHLDVGVGQVNGDANRLQQVVWNLLSNAVKFTPSGGRVEVRLERLGDYAQIQIRDTGQGISPDFLPYVFEYFRQADSSMTRRFGGLGLGLAIVRHLVELHGGTVKAESPGSGMGATLTVQLPLKVSLQTFDSKILPTQKSRSLSGLCVLIVDDEADMRELIRFILEEQGATVRVAASATEALQQFMKSAPDVLISDVGMPEMDGYALMRQIRALLSEQGKVIPAIALTAYAGNINQRQALAAGFQRHLAKPIEPEQLVNAVEQVIA